jgi:aromatic ring-cleaving dioxygenase
VRELEETKLAEPETGTIIDPQKIQGYHAHIYYNPGTRASAERVRLAIAGGFEARVGNWHDEPVGPHPASMCRIAFAVSEFPRLVPWLMLNRQGLDVLVHPMTDDPYEDHAKYAMWLGKPLPLRLDGLRRTAQR